MSPTISSAVGWVRRRAENVVAGLLGIMFLAFIIQIVFRYFFNFPIGWTSELSVIAWLYMTLLGSAFWLKESDEIRFDLISDRLGPLGRRVVGLVVAVAAVLLIAATIFGLIAAYQALVSIYQFDAVEAAAIMAGVLLVIGLTVLAIVPSMGRPPKEAPAPSRLASDPAAMIDQGVGKAMQQVGPVPLLVAAFLAGIFAGRR